MAYYEAFKFLSSLQINKALQNGLYSTFADLTQSFSPILKKKL
jgi:hypothetical protein